MVKKTEKPAKAKKEKKAHKIPEWKIQEVKEIQKLCEKYPNIAVINLENLPAKQLATIRRKLKEKVVFKIAKKLLIKKSLESAKNENAKKLVENLKGIPSLVFTNMNAFELFKIFKDNSMPAPAKAGQTAPDDIWVQAGPTPFMPGPMISILSSLKIKAGVEAGKIAIKEDSLVVKKGEKVSQAAANVLAALGIEPMQIGVDVTAVLENSDLYFPSVLNIDMEKVLNDIRVAYTNALKLAIETKIVNKETIAYMVRKAHSEAKALEEKIIVRS